MLFMSTQMHITSEDPIRCHQESHIQQAQPYIAYFGCIASTDILLAWKVNTSCSYHASSYKAIPLWWRYSLKNWVIRVQTSCIDSTIWGLFRIIFFHFCCVHTCKRVNSIVWINNNRYLYILSIIYFYEWNDVW